MEEPPRENQHTAIEPIDWRQLEDEPMDWLLAAHPPVDIPVVGEARQRWHEAADAFDNGPMMPVLANDGLNGAGGMMEDMRDGTREVILLGRHPPRFHPQRG